MRLTLPYHLCQMRNRATDLACALRARTRLRGGRVLVQKQGRSHRREISWRCLEEQERYDRSGYSNTSAKKKRSCGPPI